MRLLSVPIFTFLSHLDSPRVFLTESLCTTPNKIAPFPCFWRSIRWSVNKVCHHLLCCAFQSKWSEANESAMSALRAGHTKNLFAAAFLPHRKLNMFMHKLFEEMQALVNTLICTLCVVWLDAGKSYKLIVYLPALPPSPPLTGWCRHHFLLKIIVVLLLLSGGIPFVPMAKLLLRCWLCKFTSQTHKQGHISLRSPTEVDKNTKRRWCTTTP